MPDCPAIDGVTVVKKSDGRVGLPIDPRGGIIVNQEGIGVRNQSTPFSASMLTFFSRSGLTKGVMSPTRTNAYFKRQGDLVFFQIYYRKLSSTAFTASPDFEFWLPYKADPDFPALYGDVALYNTHVNPTVSYRRVLHLMPGLESFKLATMGPTRTFVTGTSPFTWRANCQLSISGQYFADPDDMDLIWYH